MKCSIACKPKVNETSLEEKNLFIEALVNLLQVKNVDTEGKKKRDDFFNYVFVTSCGDLKNFKLAEIYTAYDMAMKGKLLLDNERIKILPELSNITFSQIIQALDFYKKNNEDYLNAKHDLINAKTEEQKLKEKQFEKQKILEFWKNTYNFIMEIGFHRSAWVLYDKLTFEESLIVDPELKKKKYSEVSEDYKKELAIQASEKQHNSNGLEYKSWLVGHKKILDQVDSKKSGYVIEVCKAFFVCNWMVENKITESDFIKMVLVSEIRDLENLKENLSEILVFKDTEIQNETGNVFSGGINKGKVVITDSGKYTFVEK